MKSVLFFLLVAFFAFVTPTHGAGAGACSWHSGVSCGSGSDFDGSVICTDGWRDSSVRYVDVCSKAERSLSVLDYQKMLERIDCKGLPKTEYPNIFTEYEKLMSERSHSCDEAKKKLEDFGKKPKLQGPYLDRASFSNAVSAMTAEHETLSSALMRCEERAGAMLPYLGKQAYAKVASQCREIKKSKALAACPRNSVLDLNLKCHCPFAHYLNDGTNRCEEYPFVGKPKTKNQRDNCAVVAVKARKTYYLHSSKSFQRLALSTVECLKDEAAAKKLKYKRLP